MIEIIQKELKQIEEKENLTILYACESGSRAWGFPSKDSDYDVRFIYMRPLEWYFAIDDRKDTLEFPINDVLDLSGWDIRKALKLFRSSNAVIYEWLQSPVVYKKETDFAEKLTKLFPDYFSLRAGMHHYLSMTKTCYKEELQKESVKLKKYFYALRPALACKWIASRREVPPMEFPRLRELIKEEKELNKVIDQLLIQKMDGDEKDLIRSVDILNDFIRREIKQGEAFAEDLEKTKGSTEELDQLFRQLLKI
jgi:uncharacterized protein